MSSKGHGLTQEGWVLLEGSSAPVALGIFTSDGLVKASGMVAFGGTAMGQHSDFELGKVDHIKARGLSSDGSKPALINRNVFGAIKLIKIINKLGQFPSTGSLRHPLRDIRVFHKGRSARDSGQVEKKQLSPEQSVAQVQL